MNKVYNTAEVANILKVKPLTVRQYILDKRLRASQIGRSYIITEESLEEFLNNNVVWNI